MSYKKFTTQIIELIEDSKDVLNKIQNYNTYIMDDNAWVRKCKIQNEFSDWNNNVIRTLQKNELKLEALKINNIYNDTSTIPITTVYNNMSYEEKKMRLIIDELIKIGEKLENNIKEFSIITIDDIDILKKTIKDVDISELTGKYDNSAFLEDDVENVFIRILGETSSYKEGDSGAETRDLYTDRIFIDNKRYSSVIAFKGRGVKGELHISDCGINGNQLLKLAKNTFSELFIVQHVNKINHDVREALKDHLFVHSTLSKIKVCFIDGLDTARILKGAGEDLEKLKNNKSKSGRKPTMS